MSTSGHRKQACPLSFSMIAAIGLSASIFGGCASRTVVEDVPAPVASKQPRPEAFDRDGPPVEQPRDGPRQGVGAPVGPVWMDDPAKRRGPQGQPAPYGRDTVTGRPVSELPPTGAPPETGYYPPPPRQPGAAAPTRPTRPVAPAPAAPAAVSPVAPGGTVVVGKGETLFAIARRHKVSVEALARANNLTGEKIQAGQTLIIPAR